MRRVNVIGSTFPTGWIYRSAIGANNPSIGLFLRNFQTFPRNLSSLLVATKNNGIIIVNRRSLSQVVARSFSTVPPISLKDIQMELNKLCHAGDLTKIQTLLRDHSRLNINWEDDSLR